MNNKKFIKSKAYKDTINQFIKDMYHNIAVEPSAKERYDKLGVEYDEKMMECIVPACESCVIVERFKNSDIISENQIYNICITVKKKYKTNEEIFSKCFEPSLIYLSTFIREKYAGKKIGFLENDKLNIPENSEEIMRDVIKYNGIILNLKSFIYPDIKQDKNEHLAILVDFVILN